MQLGSNHSYLDDQLKDANDAESRRALTSIVKPSGESTRTLQVISNALDVKPAAACKVTGFVDEDEVTGFVDEDEVTGFMDEDEVTGFADEDEGGAEVDLV